VGYHDPYVPSLSLDGQTLRSEELLSGVKAADIVVVVTDHSAFDYGEIVSNARLVLDTRNATRGIKSPKVLKI
jgi:UDP-N-acetyl-D-glucosamine dehydrogenase